MTRFTAAFLVLVGCASSMQVRGGFDSGASIDGHSSYELAASGNAPVGFPKESLSKGVLALARKHVEEELGQRGYQQHANADMVVRLSSGRRRVEEGKAITVAGERFEAKVETEGQLVVELFDRETRRRLYHGVAQDVVVEGKIDDAQIKEAVRRIFLGFPSVCLR